MFAVQTDTFINENGFRPKCDASHTSHFRLLLSLPKGDCEMGVAVMQRLLTITAIAAIALGLAVSAAWAGFLGFQLFRAIGLMF
jgi:hypothetical protein